MKHKLRTWKIIDIIGQILMLLAPMFYFSLGMDGDQYRSNSGLKSLGVALFTVGGWQTISFLVHLIGVRASWRAGGRKVYNVMYAIVASLGLIALTASKSGGDNSIIIIMFIIACLGLVMAILYFCLTVKELNNINALPPDTNYEDELIDN